MFIFESINVDRQRIVSSGRFGNKILAYPASRSARSPDGPMCGYSRDYRNYIRPQKQLSHGVDLKSDLVGFQYWQRLLPARNALYQSG